MLLSRAISRSAQYYTLAAQTDVSPSSFQHDPKTFPVFMSVWPEKYLIFKSCPMHTLCLAANQPQVKRLEAEAREACEVGVVLQWSAGWGLTHYTACFSCNFPVGSPRSVFDRYLVLREGKTSGCLKWQQSLQSWSNSPAALMSSVLTSYQSWQTFMWCFAHGDTVYVCVPKPLQRSIFHLHSLGFWFIALYSNLNVSERCGY